MHTNEEIDFGDMTNNLIMGKSNEEEPIRVATRDDKAKQSQQESRMVFGKDYEQSMKRPSLVEIDPLRFVSYNLLAISIALGANFLGVSTNIMSNTAPNYFRSIRVDQLYPIDGFRRYVDADNKYEFMFPSQWVIDQSILMTKYATVTCLLS